LFLGATFALGLIGGRFLKSSSRSEGGGGAAHEPSYSADEGDEYGFQAESAFTESDFTETEDDSTGSDNQGRT
jgi:hypothetical protein